MYTMYQLFKYINDQYLGVCGHIWEADKTELNTQCITLNGSTLFQISKIQLELSDLTPQQFCKATPLSD